MSEPKGPTIMAANVERHGRDMKKVNDKLRDLISTLQVQKERLGCPTLVPAPQSPPAMPGAEVGAVVLERKRLEAELALAHEQLGRVDAERAELRGRLAELEVEHRRVCDQFVEAEEQAGQLVQLFATLQQIHGAADREALLQVVQEVVVNVVGSEELAIFEVRGGALVLARAFGVDPAALRRVPLGEGPLGRAAVAGRPLVAGRDPELDGDDLLTACVPLTAGGTPVGLVAIWRLLGHKPLLGPADQDVFALLGPHAGQALRLRRAAEPSA